MIKSYSIQDNQRILKFIIPNPNNGCFLWTGAKLYAGYGRFTLFVDSKWKSFSAHRVMYEMYKGEIPPNIDVCHKCDNPSCVNPEHLFLGTRKDNLKDMTIKGRRRNQNNYKIHCKYGHILLDENLFIDKLKKRCCKECNRNRALKSYYKKKESKLCQTN